jgi:DNA-binding CsgD family transcriptional regulator
MGEERARTRDALSVLDHYHNPCFLIGQSGSVEHRNLAAARFLEEETELYVTADRRLRARSGGNDSRLRDAIENARDVTVDASSGVPSMVRIRRESARDLAVLVFPVRAAYQPMEPATWSTIVLIMDPQSRLEDTGTVLARYFGLTPKERKLALHLLDGRSLDRFAEEEAIGIGTARWHLKNLLSKTQTSRQGEMVALLMRLFTPR